MQLPDVPRIYQERLDSLPHGPVSCYMEADFSAAPYVPLSPVQQTIRHIGEHIGSAGYKIEKVRRGDLPEKVLAAEVTPDLYMYGIILINAIRQCHQDTNQPDPDIRLPHEQHALEAVTGFRGQDLLAAGASLNLSRGAIDRWVEPLEHGSQRDDRLITDEAIPEVFMGAYVVARLGGVENISAALYARMARPQPSLAVADYNLQHPPRSALY